MWGVLLGAGITALGAIVVWVVNHFIPGLWRRAARSPDLNVHVETDPGIIWAGAPPWMSYSFVVSSISDLGEPPSQPCANWWKWARSLGGVDAGYIEVRVTLTAATDSTVIVDGLRPRIVKRESPPRWPVVLCAAAGGADLTYRGVHVDLDDFATPTTRFVAQDGNDTTRAPVLSVHAGEAEMFHVTASARHEYVEWVAELLLIVNGKRRTVTIDDNGAPFRTCATDLKRWYWWIPDEGWKLEERT